MSDNQVVFQPTVEDGIAAYRLHYWRNFTRNAGRRFVIWVAICAGVLAVFTRDQPIDWWSAAPLILVAGLIATPFGLLTQLMLPRMVRKTFAQQKNLHQPFTVTWHADHVRVETPSSHDDIPVSALHQWRENSKMILIYQSAVMFRFVPKRLLTPGQLISIQTTLANAGIRKA